MSKLVTPRVGRREQLSQQERLIEQRKREIEDKLKRNAKEVDVSDIKTQPNVSSDNIIPENSDIKSSSSLTDDDLKSSPTASSSVVNKFANDGSFFTQFLEMQKIGERNTLSNIDIKTESVTTPQNKETKQSIKAIKMIVKEIKSKVKAVNCVEESNLRLSDDEEEDNTVFPPEVQSAIERTALSVVINGIEAEETIRQIKAEDKDYCWLRDQLSPQDSEYYQYFQKRVKQLSAAKSRAQNDGLFSSDGAESDSNSNKGVKRQRKSRWSDEKTDFKPDSALIHYAIQVFGNTDLSSDQWKQLEDQRKMKMLCQMLEQKQKSLEMMANAGKVKYEYDSDEDTTDGTWEHKRRRQEMTQTQRIAQQLTESASGKHHIGDFMPPEELEKFMQKWDALKEGNPLSPDSDYINSKLQSDNVGFQMLKKLGWVEGQGLGSDGSGISEPINKSLGAGNHSGLGQIRPQELKEGDDEYEAYRKRMMMAYRFRPNPMNNPRRAYY